MLNRDQPSSHGSDTPANRTKRIRLGGLVVGSAAVVAAAVIGSGTQFASPSIANAVPKPTASVEGGTDPDTAWRWYQKNIGTPYTTMDDALKAWSSAMQAGNFDAMHASCSQISGAGASFQGILPSPNSAANFRLQGVADDLFAAGEACRALPPGTNWDTAADMLSHVNSAKARIKAAGAIMQPYG